MAGILSALAFAAGHAHSAGVLKMLAATGYVATALAAGAVETLYGRVLLAGLALCWAGDLLLIPRGRGPAFLGGVAAFLLGHLAYAAAFVVHGVNLEWTFAAAIAAALAGWRVLRWIEGHRVPPGLRAPVHGYVAAISAMVALSVGAGAAGGPWIVPAGAVAFMASDVLVARERFVEATAVNTLVGLPLYFLAQALLALSVTGR